MTTKNHKPRQPEDPEDRVGRLRRQVEELTGEPVVFDESGSCPERVKEKFLENIIAFEQAEQTSLFDRLVQGGMSLPPPEALDDAALTAKLWEVINGLSRLGAYLDSTDHLSDRELYASLWREALREPAVLFPDNPNYAYHIDLIGSGSEEDILLYLKYYADGDERRQWAQEWPDEVLPDPQPLPFDRDSRLPQPKTGSRFSDE